jgi:NTE family protein
MRTRRLLVSRLIVAGTLLLLAGCMSRELKNKPLVHWPADGIYPTTRQFGNGRSGDLLLIVAFSGGGTRAAAFSYGVLEELRDTRVTLNERHRRLLDEVDILSGVSGGSFPAAYYGLYGDSIFRDFETRFLKNDIQDKVLVRIFDPTHWYRSLSPYYGRWEIASDYYDDLLFHGATFGDLARVGGPVVIINATDISTGGRFNFTNSYFGRICSDLASFPISVAVTASSAVPLLFSPITLENYSGTCDYEPLPWFRSALKDPNLSSRSRAFALEDSAFVDSRKRRYIHLLDGGISDNLGIREIFDRVVREGPDLTRLLAGIGHPKVRDIVMILVNSQTEPAYNKAISDISPDLPDVLDAVTSVQIDRYNFETQELIQESFDKWTLELSSGKRPARFQMITVSFDDIASEAERQYLHNLPTNFKLTPDQVDHLRRMARVLLRNNPKFQSLVRSLRPVSTD